MTNNHYRLVHVDEDQKGVVYVLFAHSTLHYAEVIPLPRVIQQLLT